jgi:hypothetical protein
MGGIECVCSCGFSRSSCARRTAINRRASVTPDQSGWVRGSGKPDSSGVDLSPKIHLRALIFVSNAIVYQIPVSELGNVTLVFCVFALSTFYHK